MLNKLKKIFSREPTKQQLEQQLKGLAQKLSKLEDDVNMGIASKKTIKKYNQIMEEIKNKMAKLEIVNGKLVKSNNDNNQVNNQMTENNQEQKLPEFKPQETLQREQPVEPKLPNLTEAQQEEINLMKHIAQPQQPPVQPQEQQRPQMTREEYELGLKYQEAQRLQQQAQQQAKLNEQQALARMQERQNIEKLQQEQAEREEYEAYMAMQRAQQQAEQSQSSEEETCIVEITTTVGKFTLPVYLSYLDEFIIKLDNAVIENKIIHLVENLRINGRYIITYNIKV